MKAQQRVILGAVLLVAILASYRPTGVTQPQPQAAYTQTLMAPDCDTSRFLCVARGSTQEAATIQPTKTAVDEAGFTMVNLYMRYSVEYCSQGKARLPWTVVAGIGKIESGHGTIFGSKLDSNNTAQPPIKGVVLDGSVPKTAALKYKGSWERAEGPMQFLRKSWDIFGVDADGDGIKNRQDADDAIAAAVIHLCGKDQAIDDASEPSLRAMIYGYNRSDSYVNDVLAKARWYGGY